MQRLQRGCTGRMHRADDPKSGSGMEMIATCLAGPSAVLHMPSSDIRTPPSCGKRLAVSLFIHSFPVCAMSQFDRRRYIETRGLNINRSRADVFTINILSGPPCIMETGSVWETPLPPQICMQPEFGDECGGVQRQRHAATSLTAGGPPSQIRQSMNVRLCKHGDVYEVARCRTFLPWAAPSGPQCIE